MTEYIYTPLENPGSEIRLLTIPWRITQYQQDRMYEPLTGRLSHHYLPGTDFAPTQRLFRGFRLPAFTALSYVWGDPTLSHEIFIDGKRLAITANLHAMLWRLHIDSIADITIWADAICINQEDLAERSAQIQLMRQVYHLAAVVRIWLGIGKRETSRGMQFIAYISGSKQAQISRYLAREEKANTDAPASRTAASVPKKILLTPVALLLIATGLLLGVAGRTLISLSQPIMLTGDVLNNATQDTKKTLMSISDASYQRIINDLTSWRPTSHALKKAQTKEANFGEIAHLINQWLISKPDWFTRMWVVQEVGAASNVFIQCGRCLVTWTDFLRAVCYLHFTNKSPVKDIERVIALEQIRTAWARGMRPPLQDLIYECRRRRSTDARDKIYALLGLMGDSMSDFLRPDYSKSINEVYANVARHFITQTKSLNPICGQQAQGRLEDLPSWVPDFALDQNLAPSPLVAVAGNKNIFFASGRDKRSEYSLARRNRNNEEWHLLPVRGLVIGTVSSISVLVGPVKDRPSDSPERRWHHTLAIASSLLETTQKTSNRLGEFSRGLREYVKFLDSEDPPELRGTTSDETFARDLCSIGNDNIVSTFVQSLLCGRFSPQERLNDNHVEGILASFNTRLPLGYLDRFPTAFESGIRRRRLIVTEDGYIGAAPAETVVSDLVCVLFGCSVPVVLRPITDADEFTLIGECYVYGFMDGEAVARLETGEFTIRDFVLK